MPSDDNLPYNGASERWPGLAKVMEEMGELQQILAKVMNTDDIYATYWNGKSLIPLMEEEISDVYASLDFFVANNPLVGANEPINKRREKKFSKYTYWRSQKTKSA